MATLPNPLTDEQADEFERVLTKDRVTRWFDIIDDMFGIKHIDQNKQ